VKGATGPALGAVFKGTNRNGIRRWSTTVTVIVCEPGKVFEFAVTSGPLAVANWRYEFEETETGCRVTESWLDKRTPWFASVARLMGDHSAPHAEQEMAATLARLAAVAE
jgi:polyketide cyclase/dehydrase/lipid transport protein